MRRRSSRSTSTVVPSYPPAQQGNGQGATIRAPCALRRSDMDPIRGRFSGTLACAAAAPEISIETPAWRTEVSWSHKRGYA